MHYRYSAAFAWTDGVVALNHFKNDNSNNRSLADIQEHTHAHAYSHSHARARVFTPDASLSLCINTRVKLLKM